VNTRDVRRILVALDASPHSQAALREAAALAERLHAELAGIFVLDAELLRVSELPVAVETGLTSATRRRLNPEDMERALKLQAGRARAALKAAAERHRLRSSFKLSRGDVVAELVAAASNVDVVALGLTGHMNVTGRRLGSTARGVAERATCSVLLLTPQSRTGLSLVVMYGSSAGSSRALERGVELARQREVELVILLCGTGAEVVELGARAEQALSREGVQAVLDDIDPDRIETLPTLLGRYDCGLLLIPHDSELVEESSELIVGLGCPVMLTK
jgi:nucleotide-binding universal stress UspA family protein